LAPLKLRDEKVVLIFLVCAEIAQTVTGDVDHFLCDREHVPGVGPFCVHEPGVESVEVGAVEELERVPRDLSLDFPGGESLGTDDDRY
jgi:hypothetical protein